MSAPTPTLDDVIAAGLGEAPEADDWYVGFAGMTCRTCGESAPAQRLRADLGAILGSWDADHRDQTGHVSYYVWRASRARCEYPSGK